MAYTETIYRNKWLSTALRVALAGLALSILAPKGATAEGSPTQETKALETKDKGLQGQRLQKSQLKEMAGRLISDAQLEVTQPLQVDKKIVFVGLSTPTATPSTNHADMWLNNTAKQICTKFDNGSSGCLSTGGISSIVAGLGLTGGGSSGTVTVALSTPITSSYIPQYISSTTVALATATLQTQISAIAVDTGTFLTKSSATATYLNTSIAAVTYAALAATQTFTGSNTFKDLHVSSTIIFSPTTVGITGTTTNDSVGTGIVGEYISSATASEVNFPTSDQWGDNVSVALTAGDWDVSVAIDGNTNNAAGITYLAAGASTTSGNSTTGLTRGATYSQINPGTNAGSVSPVTIRFSLSGSSSVYLKVIAGNSGTVPKYVGSIRARRIR